MKHLFTFFFLFLTACSSGTNENSIQTAIAETQETENKIATSHVETQLSIPINTPTKVPTPTITLDPCGEEILSNWYKEVRLIEIDFVLYFNEFMNFTVAQNINLREVYTYTEESVYLIYLLDEIDTPQCAEKVLEYLKEAILAFAKSVFYYREEVDFNVVRYSEEAIDFFEKYVDQLKVLGIID